MFLQKPRKAVKNDEKDMKITRSLDKNTIPQYYPVFIYKTIINYTTFTQSQMRG